MTFSHFKIIQCNASPKIAAYKSTDAVGGDFFAKRQR